MANVVASKEGFPDNAIVSQRRNSGHLQQASLKSITTLTVELLKILAPPSMWVKFIHKEGLLLLNPGHAFCFFQ